MVSGSSGADSAYRSSLDVEAKQNFGLRGLSYVEIQRGSNSRSYFLNLWPKADLDSSVRQMHLDKKQGIRASRGWKHAET